MRTELHKMVSELNETHSVIEKIQCTQQCFYSPCVPGLLQQESTLQERPRSSEILEELLNQGIILVGQTRQRGRGAGEAYSIMVGTWCTLVKRVKHANTPLIGHPPTG